MRGARVIVEGFIDFDYEITLLTVRAPAASGTVETHFCEPIGHVQVNGDYVESWQPQPMSAMALDARARHRRRGHGGARRPRHLRRRAVRQGRRGVVLRSEPAPARHRHGDDVHAGAERVRAARARDPRAARGHAAASPGASAVIYGGVDARGVRFEGVADALRVPGSDLRLFGKPEALQEAPHGRGARARRRHRARPCAGAGMRAPRAAAA